MVNQGPAILLAISHLTTLPVIPATETVPPFVPEQTVVVPEVTPAFEELETSTKVVVTTGAHPGTAISNVYVHVFPIVLPEIVGFDNVEKVTLEGSFQV